MWILCVSNCVLRVNCELSNTSLNYPRFAAVDSHGSFKIFSILSVYHVLYSLKTRKWIVYPGRAHKPTYSLIYPKEIDWTMFCTIMSRKNSIGQWKNRILCIGLHRRCQNNHISFQKIIRSLKYFLFDVAEWHIFNLHHLVWICPVISEGCLDTHTHILLYIYTV